MRTLTWIRADAGHWRLTDETGALWAHIEPNTAVAGRRFFRAICDRMEMPTRHNTRYWVLRESVQGAKHSIERWLDRNACAVENFRIAREREQPSTVTTALRRVAATLALLI